MSTPIESRQARVIDELRVFIKKVLSDPTIAVKSIDIARKYRSEPGSDELIAREISANTTIRIPEKWSEADRMFLEKLLMLTRQYPITFQIEQRITGPIISESGDRGPSMYILKLKMIRLIKK